MIGADPSNTFFEISTAHTNKFRHIFPKLWFPGQILRGQPLYQKVLIIECSCFRLTILLESNT